jgi:hypothetical protein
LDKKIVKKEVRTEKEAGEKNQFRKEEKKNRRRKEDIIEL